jgi:transcriptional regulator with XRE-family HTH domain
MTPIGNDIEARIASNLLRRRKEFGLSLGQLATRSGVSKAMIARVESGASSPTAGLLGRLCSGLGVTLSALMMEAESSGVSHHPASLQPTWRDPESGLQRTVVAPATAVSAVEIARLRLPPGTAIDYEIPPALAVRQHIVMLSGELEFTIAGEHTRLGPGDSLFAIIDRPTAFFVPGDVPAEYFVVQEPA